MMENIFNKITKEHNKEENLFVKNIIVNKESDKKLLIAYVPTEKWIKQLGNRLQINY